MAKISRNFIQWIDHWKEWS